MFEYDETKHSRKVREGSCLELTSCC